MTRYLPAILFVIGLLVFLLGPVHAIHQLPTEQRSRMGDFDWIGVEWIVGGMVLMATACSIWLWRWLSARAKDR